MCIDTPPYFLYEFSFIVIVLLILMNMQKSENMHISTLNKNYVWASIQYHGRMSCCFDTNHFVGTPTFFRIILCIFTLRGKGKLFKSVFSLLFSDNFVSPVTDSLFSLN